MPDVNTPKLYIPIIMVPTPMVAEECRTNGVLVQAPEKMPLTVLVRLFWLPRAAGRPFVLGAHVLGITPPATVGNSLPTLIVNAFTCMR